MFVEKFLIFIALTVTLFLRGDEPTFNVEMCILFGTGIIVGALGHIAKVLSRR